MSETPGSESMAETVRRTAQLARLAISDDELVQLVPQFERILEAFRSLARFEGPAAEAASEAPGRSRDDQARPSQTSERALANAPEPREAFFAVPKTVGGER